MSVCADKVRFPTFAAARNHAKKARRRHEEPFNAYHCNECGAYHYGARPLDKGRAARLRKARAGEAAANDDAWKAPAVRVRTAA